MSGLDELPLSTSAYLADTQHLSLPQHGAYLLILMTMWRAKGWIRDDDRVLANICKLSVPKWLRIAPEVRALLTVRDGKLSQKRLLFESETAQKRISKNVQNGRAGGIAKSLKTKEPTLANATGSPTQPPPTGQDPTKNALPSLLPSREDSDSKKKGKKERATGTTLPSDWVPSPNDVEYGRQRGMSDDIIEQHAEDMRLWAAANSNRPVGKKADWSAAFKSWMRRGRTVPPTSPRPSRGHGMAALAAQLNLVPNDEED